MKIVRNILIATAAVVALFVLLAYLLPEVYRVERRVQIKASPAQVYVLVSQPREWKRWSTWNRRDPAMKMSYTGPVQGTGAGWRWESASQGRGEMTFTGAEADRQIAYTLYFPDFDSRPTGTLTLVPVNGGTEVVWAMQGSAGLNPVMRWMNLLMDGMVGKDFEEGLANLKEVAEQKQIGPLP